MSQVTMKIQVGSALFATGMYPDPIKKEDGDIYVRLDDVELAALMSAAGHLTLVEEAQAQINTIKGGARET